MGYFAMVTMETVNAAAKCIRTFHDSHFKGTKITVKKVSCELYTLDQILNIQE